MKRFSALATAFAVIAAPAAADGLGFRTPSGNIYCNGGMETPHLYCVIVNREPGSAPDGCPAGRQFDAFIEEHGRATGQCGRAGGRVSTYTDVAQYGVTGEFGRIVCRSETKGFTCRNADGHGFFLSRRSQQVF
jgi:hypothetical protein